MENNVIDKLLKIYEYDNVKGLEFVKNNPIILEQINNIIINKEYDKDKLMELKLLINQYTSYINLLKLKDIINNPTAYKIEEKLEILNNAKKNADLNLLKKHDRNIIKFILEQEKIIRKLENIDIDYEDYISDLKKIIKLYKICENRKKFYFYSNILNFNYYEFVANDIKRLYLQSIFYNKSETNILKELSIDDISLLSNINWNIDKVNDNISDEKIKEFDKLFLYLDEINNFFKKDNRVEYFIKYLVNDLKVTLKEIEVYETLFKKYCLVKTSKYTTLFKRPLEFDLIYRFESIITKYKEYTIKTNEVINVIFGVKDNDELINIIYETKFFNEITPDMNYDIFYVSNQSIEKRDAILKFLNDYKKFYKEKTKSSTKKISNFIKIDKM